MRVFVGQIYVDASASYPFSIKWQEYLSEKLTELCPRSAVFNRLYGSDYSLVVRVSADKEAKAVIVRGPAHFARQKQVEYAIFLPHSGRKIIRRSECSDAMAHVVMGIEQVFALLGMDVEGLRANAPSWTEEILSRPDMFEHLFA